MKYFRYDGATGALIGPDFMEGVRGLDGHLVYELPRNATIVEPPQAVSGYVPIFIEETRRWVPVADHRGEQGWVDWKGRAIRIERVGNPAEWGLKREQ